MILIAAFNDRELPLKVYTKAFRKFPSPIFSFLDITHMLKNVTRQRDFVSTAGECFSTRRRPRLADVLLLNQLLISRLLSLLTDSATTIKRRFVIISFILKRLSLDLRRNHSEKKRLATSSLEISFGHGLHHVLA